MERKCHIVDDAKEKAFIYMTYSENFRGIKNPQIREEYDFSGILSKIPTLLQNMYNYVDTNQQITINKWTFHSLDDLTNILQNLNGIKKMIGFDTVDHRDGTFSKLYWDHQNNKFSIVKYDSNRQSFNRVMKAVDRYYEDAKMMNHSVDFNKLMEEKIIPTSIRNEENLLKLLKIFPDDDLFRDAVVIDRNGKEGRILYMQPPI